MDSDDTVKTLNDLIEISKDGEYGFRTSAEHLHSSETRQLFMRHADECRQAATELQALVDRLGGKPETSGTIAGATHRGWVAIKSKLSTYSDKDILEDTETGEDAAMETYRDALQKEMPAEVRAVVERQWEGVKRNHAQVRALRDHARRAAGE